MPSLAARFDAISLRGAAATSRGADAEESEDAFAWLGGFSFDAARPACRICKVRE